MSAQRGKRIGTPVAVSWLKEMPELDQAGLLCEVMTIGMIVAENSETLSLLTSFDAVRGPKVWLIAKDKVLRIKRL